MLKFFLRTGLALNHLMVRIPVSQWLVICQGELMQKCLINLCLKILTPIALQA